VAGAKAPPLEAVVERAVAAAALVAARVTDVAAAGAGATRTIVAVERGGEELAAGDAGRRAVVVCVAAVWSSECRVTAWGCGERAGGDRPVATESGSEERPTRCPESWLAAQARAADTAMPSTAASAVAIERLVIGAEG